MRTVKKINIPLLIAWVGVLALWIGQLALATPITGISLASPVLLPGETPSGISGASVFSGEGRYAFFLSTAPNLITTGASDGLAKVFRRELASGTITLVSFPSGTGTRDQVTGFSVSADSRWIAFSSQLANDALGNSNTWEDICYRDLEGGGTQIISKSNTGGSSNAESGSPVVSRDGRFVLFESVASNLVTNSDSNHTSDVFLWDRDSGTNTLVSRAPHGGSGNGPSTVVLLSEDGEQAFFNSLATDLVAAEESIPTDLFIWSRTSRIISQIQIPGEKSSVSKLPVRTYNPVLSTDGRYLAFRTQGNVSAAHEGVWWFDLKLGTKTRVSGDLLLPAVVGHADPSGPVMSRDGQKLAFETRLNTTAPARIRIWSPDLGLKMLEEMVTADSPSVVEPDSSVSPVLSPDGSLLAFETDAAVPPAGVLTSGGFRLYIRTLATGETRTPFASSNIEFAMPSPIFSPDGQFLLFKTSASLPGFTDDNRTEDVFLAPVSLDHAELVSRRDKAMVPNTGNASSMLEPGAISHDGRHVVFVSHADNLVTNDAKGLRDVFVHDLIAGTNALISVGLDGRSPTGESFQPRISADGNHVVFVSYATNLVAGDANPAAGVFVRNLTTGVTKVASAQDGNDTKGASASLNPQISANGDWVLFESGSTDLSPQAGGTGSKLFLRHLSSQRTLLISSNLPVASTAEASGTFGATMSTDGSRIAFLSRQDAYVYSVDSGLLERASIGIRAASVSLSSDGNRLALLGNVSNSATARAVYWCDLQSKTTTRIAASVNVQQNLFGNVSISGNGQVVTFESNFAPPNFTDSNGVSDVFAFDISTRVLSCVSAVKAGNQSGNGSSDSPSLSTDGRLVTFRSTASDLVADDTNALSDVFVRNLRTGQTELLSRRSVDQQPGSAASSHPFLSGDGHLLVFRSMAGDLLGGDYNQSGDLFTSILPAGLQGRFDFSPPAMLTLKDSPFLLNSITQEGLSVTYEVVSGPASIRENQLFLTDIGSVVVRATQSGNEVISPLSITNTITITKASQTLTWVSPSTGVALQVHHPYLLDATANSGLTVMYSIVSGSALIDGNQLTPMETGLLVVRAIQSGNHEFLPISVDEKYEVESASEAPTLTGFNILGTDHLRISVDGATGSTVVIQTTMDFKNWVPLTTNTLPYTVELKIPAEGQSGFYRAILQPAGTSTTTANR